MTEAEWLACGEPQRMLEFLQERGRLTERRLRLFACACCRRVIPSFHDRRLTEAVEVAERLADGMAAAGEREEAARALLYVPGLLDDVRRIGVEDRAGHVRHHAACAAMRALDAAHWATNVKVAARYAAAIRYWEAEADGEEAALRAEQAVQAGLIRCVFASPFHNSVSPAHSPMTSSLAVGACAARGLPSGHLDNARLAVLSDALEDAGCSDAAILSHLRSPAPHVRGCWALDLILGKS